MSKLIAVTFKDQADAFDLRADLVRMQSEYLLQLEDAVVVTLSEDGKPKLHQAMNLTAAGAFSGGWWGMFIGLLFLNPLIGAAVGAGFGALSGKLTDIGIDDAFMKGVGEDMKPGHATVFVLARDITRDKVIEGLEKYRGKGVVQTTSISKQDEDELRALFEKA